MARKYTRKQIETPAPNCTEPLAVEQPKPIEPSLTAMRVMGVPEYYRIGALANVQFGKFTDKRVMQITKMTDLVRVTYEDGSYEEFARAGVSLYYEPIKAEEAPPSGG